MTNRLDLVIARLHDLPDADQDRLAETILGWLGDLDGGPELSSDQIAEVHRRRQGLAENLSILASEDEMRALWAHCGL